ncbi:MAG TPA: hypothetical protein VE970_09460 [Pseudolabrys sp.]|nr:hypothetical protein [Pseudolabrys sp.]
MIYRFLAVIGSAAALAACSSDMAGFKSGPFLDTVSLESEPPGAEAKASNGQTCRTPCSLAMPVDASASITFTLNGYQPETEKLEAITSTGEPPRLRPNPVVVELSPGAPSTAKKSTKPATKKPATRTKTTAAPPPPAPMTAAPAQAPSSPWPTIPPVGRQ